jgi:hypothetical protein
MNDSPSSLVMSALIPSLAVILLMIVQSHLIPRILVTLYSLVIPFQSLLCLILQQDYPVFPDPSHLMLFGVSSVFLLLHLQLDLA